MGNKVTKNVAHIDENMMSVKNTKRKSVDYIDNCQKQQEGGDWSIRGYGTERDDGRLEKNKNYVKADYIEHSEPTLEDMLSGTGAADPVKKPTMKNVGVVEPTKKYLKEFSSDETIKQGHVKIK